MEPFVHLHVHSHYSLLDGANRIEDLVALTAEQGGEALALTDHGNLFGAVEFYSAAKKAGIKPILGIEAYISPTTRFDRTMGNIQTAAYHIILLATSTAGWRNLLRLSSRAFLEGFYYRPRIDRDLLAECSEGLICTTACLGGEVPSALLAGQDSRARKIAAAYRDIFGPQRFFIEIQNQDLPDQHQVNPQLVALAEELGVGLVGTNDVHFLRPDDKKAHEVLTCISTGKTLAGGGAMEYSPQLYLKSPTEMHAALRDFPGAASNTCRIAEMCDLELDFTAKHLPVFSTPAGQTPDEYLARLATEGLAKRFGGAVPAEYNDRLQRELDVIAQKGYSSYFLIVNDFVQYARRNNIPAAPRGSGVATLLGYALGISQLDPVRYGLLFERFTDPARQEDPDMDIDICQEGRAQIIQYVRQKYGHVAQIITYGTLKARAAIRDVGRVLDMPLPEVDAITKLVPEGPKVTLASALAGEPELRSAYESDPRVGEVIDYSLRLEGLARHAGVHAAGVVVCDQPLEQLVPLCKQGDNDDAITQWDGNTCGDKVGLMKIDFLGLRTLTTIQRARELVCKHSGKNIDPETLPLDDPAVYELFRNGETDGVFQFESDGMKNVLLQMQPNRIEDLIAANAMYRPGPMALIPTYCARKSGTEPVPSVHGLVDDILEETYGIMCYQEQVMQVLNRLGKLPLNRALTLIKAISKKKHKLIASERVNFLAGAKDNGIADDEAQRLFELILNFAGYGFNKAHSTRYAIVAYQTAYFKVHHPREFMAALLTLECGDTDKVVQYMAEAQRMDIEIASPDVNTCNRDFTVDGERVRFGLAAVKGVGAKAVDAIIAARAEDGAFGDLFDFCCRVDLRAVNRTTIDALVKCGAFDSLGAHRAAMSAAVDNAIQMGHAAASERKSGQMNLLAALGEADTPPAARFPDVEPWSESQLLAAEKETLGFYISSHPLVRYGRELTSLSVPAYISLSRLQKCPDSTPVTIGCMIASVHPTFTRKDNRKMAMLTLEDLTGKADAVAFPDTYNRLGELLKPESLVFVVGRIDRRREKPSIIINNMIPIDQALEQLTDTLLLRLGGGSDPAPLVRKLQDILARHSGKVRVMVELMPAKRRDVLVRLRSDQQWSVHPSRELINQLLEILEEKDLLLQPKSQNANHNGSRFVRRSAPGAFAGNEIF